MHYLLLIHTSTQFKCLCCQMDRHNCFLTLFHPSSHSKDCSGTRIWIQTHAMLLVLLEIFPAVGFQDYYYSCSGWGLPWMARSERIDLRLWISNLHASWLIEKRLEWGRQPFPWIQVIFSLYFARCGNQQENPQNCAEKVMEELGMRPFNDEGFHEQ